MGTPEWKGRATVAKLDTGWGRGEGDGTQGTCWEEGSEESHWYVLEISESDTAGPGIALFLSTSSCYNIDKIPRNLTLIYIN